MVTLLIAARRHDDGMTAVLLSSDAALQPGARESLAVESYLGFFCSASLFILRSSKTFFQWQLSTRTWRKRNWEGTIHKLLYPPGASLGHRIKYQLWVRERWEEWGVHGGVQNNVFDWNIYRSVETSGFYIFRSAIPSPKRGLGRIQHLSQTLGF